MIGYIIWGLLLIRPIYTLFKFSLKDFDIRELRMLLIMPVFFLWFLGFSDESIGNMIEWCLVADDVEDAHPARFNIYLVLNILILIIIITAISTVPYGLLTLYPNTYISPAVSPEAPGNF